MVLSRDPWSREEWLHGRGTWRAVAVLLDESGPAPEARSHFAQVLHSANLVHAGLVALRSNGEIFTTIHIITSQNHPLCTGRPRHGISFVATYVKYSTS